MIFKRNLGIYLIMTSRVLINFLNESDQNLDSKFLLFIGKQPEKFIASTSLDLMWTTMTAGMQKL